jgi:hypothetical protein
LQREPLQVHLRPTPGLGFPSHASSEDDDSVPPLNSPVDRLSMIDSPYAGQSFSRMHPAKSCRPFLSYSPLMCRHLPFPLTRFTARQLEVASTTAFLTSV